MVILGGWAFLMSEVPLYWNSSREKVTRAATPLCEAKQSSAPPSQQGAGKTSCLPDRGICERCPGYASLIHIAHNECLFLHQQLHT